ncbi:hypothetical protein [Vibrio gallaecicus]|nr:hypothetical protein [Vibrio gallaecicus]MDN3612924.1 hypothetical protein [Vibrio gallaecicus]
MIHVPYVSVSNRCLILMLLWFLLNVFSKTLRRVDVHKVNVMLRGCL